MKRAWSLVAALLLGCGQVAPPPPRTLDGLAPWLAAMEATPVEITCVRLATHPPAELDPLTGLMGRAVTAEVTAEPRDLGALGSRRSPLDGEWKGEVEPPVADRGLRVRYSGFEVAFFGDATCSRLEIDGGLGRRCVVTPAAGFRIYWQGLPWPAR